VARYLIKTKDLLIVYVTHDTHGLVLYGFSDSDWGAKGFEKPLPRASRQGLRAGRLRRQ
jgi:hypothetical protein